MDDARDHDCPVCRAQKRVPTIVTCGYCNAKFDIDEHHRVCPECGCWYGATPV